MQDTARDRPATSLDTSKKAIGTMNDRDVVDFVNANIQESQERMKPIAAMADTCWMLYRNKEDFSDKEDWQFKVPLPKAYAVVKRAAANMVKLYMMSDKLIRVKGWGMENLLAPFIEKGLNNLIRSEDYQFLDALEDALESALACDMGILKSFPIIESIDPVDFSGDTRRQRTNLSLRAKAIDFRRFWMGPYSTPHKFDWCAESSTVPYAYLRDSGRYRSDALEKIQRESFEEKPEEIKSWVRYDFAQPWMRSNLRLAMTEIVEWYGDIIDRDGKIAGRAKKVTLFNRKHLAKIEDYTESPPYAVFSPLNVAFRFPGEGIINANVELFRAANRLANLKGDAQFYSELKQFEVDLSLLENAADISTGIEPGKMYRKRQGTNAVPAIREIQVSGSKPTSFEMDARLDQEIQRGTFISDYITSAPSSGADLATEVQSQVAASGDMLLNMAERIERQGLDRMAAILFQQMLLFLDSSTRPNWTILLEAPNLLDTLTTAQRRKIIGTNYTFEFTGLSEQLWLQEQAKRILQTLGFLKDNPMLIALFDMPRMVKDLAKGMGTIEYVHPNAEQHFQMMLQQQLMAQQNARQQKIEDMGAQFKMRNEEAMKRDAFRHELKRDDDTMHMGFKAATESVQ